MKILLLGRFYHNLVRLEEDVQTKYQIGIDNLENLATTNVSESKQLKEKK